MTAPWRTLNRAEQLDWLLSRWRLAVPVAASIAGTFLLTAPLFPGTAILPHVPLVAVLVWSVYRPSLLPSWLALLLGALADCWLGLPLGINATLLPAVSLGLHLLDRRFPDRPFAVDWTLALPIIAACQLVQGQLLRLLGHDVALSGLMPQALTTWLLYPAVAYLLAAINRRWLEVV